MTAFSSNWQFHKSINLQHKFGKGKADKNRVCSFNQKLIVVVSSYSRNDERTNEIKNGKIDGKKEK